jgi:hypothetical protein
MMLLMRGGVLAIAPIADLVGGRVVRWFSWVALALSAMAMAAAGFRGRHLRPLVLGESSISPSTSARTSSVCAS